VPWAAAPHVLLRWSFQERRLRSLRLRDEAPHAQELLGVYISLLELQSALHELTRAWGGPGPDEPAALEERSTLPLSCLLLPEVLPHFRGFLRNLTSVGTQVIADLTGALREAPEDLLSGVLEDCLRMQPPMREAERLSGLPTQLTLLARAFLQPIAEAIAERYEAGGVGSGKSSCPRCGWPPQLSFFREDPKTGRGRFLLCALCGTDWAFPRATCPRCGEGSSEALLYHEADSLPHIRVEECLSCQTYLKGVDLTKYGLAVPPVDELAAVELDVWAAGRGLRKLEPNVLGL